MLPKFLIIPSFLWANVLCTHANHQFRKDYVYNKRTNAFYKLHIEPRYYEFAENVCKSEGGKLMISSTKDDLMQLHSMAKRYPDITNYVWVGNDGEDCLSSEENMISDSPEVIQGESINVMEKRCEAISREVERVKRSCFERLPFMCKVESDQAVYDRNCDVYANGYQILTWRGKGGHPGSCYKVPSVAYSWDEGYEECANEGAHLAVINSLGEARAVGGLLKNSPRIFEARASFFFFVGIRANRTKDGKPREFRTIFNETLDDAGYNEWSDKEPNNYMDSEYCGSFFTNDYKFNDLECAHLFGIVCEKELKTSS